MTLNQNLNIVAFTRGLLVQKDQEHIHSDRLRNELEATTLQAELMKLGFILDQPAFTHLMKWRAEDGARYFNDILPVAKELVGAKAEVETPEEADVRFTWEDFVADYASVAEFMAVTPSKE